MLLLTKHRGHQHFTRDQLLTLVGRAGLKPNNIKSLLAYPFDFCTLGSWSASLASVLNAMASLFAEVSDRIPLTCQIVFALLVAVTLFRPCFNLVRLVKFPTEI